MQIGCRKSTRKILSLSARQPDELLQGETVLIGWVDMFSRVVYVI